MYKILGADGREYGPVEAGQLRKWIQEGRANHETMAQAAGETGWKPLGQHPEFADLLLSASPPIIAGPAPAAPASSPAPLPASVAPAPSQTDARARARQAVSGPAIGLIVTAIFGLGWKVFGLVLHALGVGFGRMPPNINPEAARLIQLFSGGLGVALDVFGIAIAVFVLIGALRMQKLSNHGLAVAAAIVAMVPCFSPCCLIGLPIGIWALVVLNQPEVSSQFER